jgi:hypothetical protein
VSFDSSSACDCNCDCDVQPVNFGSSLLLERAQRVAIWGHSAKIRARGARSMNRCLRQIAFGGPRCTATLIRKNESVSGCVGYVDLL